MTAMGSNIKIKPPSYLNVANLVSLIRLILLPVFFYFLFYYITWRNKGEDLAFLAHTYYLVTVVLVPIVLLTDYLDGWLARRYQLENPLGAFLDPLADKFFAFCSMLLLAWAEALPVWLVMVVFFKELFILCGWVLLFILGYNTEISPCKTGKAVTVCQGTIIFVALLTLPGQEIIKLSWFPLFTIADCFNRAWFHIITAGLTTLAGAFYVLEGLERSQAITPVNSEKVAILQVGDSPGHPHEH